MILLGGPLDSEEKTLLSHQEVSTLVGSVTTPFGALFLRSKLTEMQRLAALVCDIPRLAPLHMPGRQVAMLLLVFCVAPKCDHLFRMLPPDQVAD